MHEIVRFRGSLYRRADLTEPDPSAVPTSAPEPKRYTVTFKTSRDGTPWAHLTPPKSSPAYQQNDGWSIPCFAQRGGPQPKPGETWEVEWAGENARKTVGFLRLLRQLDSKPKVVPRRRPGGRIF